MLNRIKLTFFRKHTNTELSFSQGLVVIRGANEDGKSTLLEGISYALGGAKFLRESLEDVVTYYKEGGVITHREPVSALKTELDITLDGVDYFVKRSKSGAEVNYDGGRVTGQTEVTNFLFAKMGVDPSAACRLQFASQKDIRGALEAGPKATMDLIERLAEFDQFDLLIERMQQRLTLGTTSALSERLEEAQQALAALGDDKVPDYAAMEAQIAQLDQVHKDAQAAFEALEGDVSKAQAQLDLARAAQNTYEQAVANHQRAQRRFATASQDLAAARDEADREVVWPAPQEAMQAQISELEQAGRVLASYRAVEPYFTSEAVGFNGSRETLAERIKECSDFQIEAQRSQSDARAKVAAATAQISTGTCGFCGQDFSHLPEVAKKNAELLAVIEAGEAQVLKDGATMATLKASEENYRHIARLADHRATLLGSYSEYVKAKDVSLPATLVWTGPDLETLTNSEGALQQLREQLNSLLGQQRALDQAKARAQTLEAAAKVAEAEVNQARLVEEVAQVRPDLAAAEAARDAGLARRRPLQQLASDAQTQHRDAQYGLRDAQREHAAAIQKREHLQDGITSLTHQIKTTEFNNVLLKRVRQCRPVIADKLWTIVLSAVSSYFSEMRSDKSRVTKDADGFKVDGAGVGGLSGSTLDVLGLAIRVALVRTFLPNSPFMVLDEPCAAMDQARTEATLGFVVACGFKQVVCASHDPVSTSVADSVLEVGP